MENRIQTGVYEDLITNGLRVELSNAPSSLVASEQNIDDAELPNVLNRHLSKILLRSLQSFSSEEIRALGPKLVNEVLKKAQALTGEGYEDEEISDEPKMLAEISAKLPNGEVQRTDRPLIPISETTFLTNAKGEPNLNNQIDSEVASSKTIDVLMAFVRWTGVFPLLAKLKSHIDSGGRVRLITTTYMNHTEPRALEELKKIGVEIKISYDESQTRLHAKAWLFSRARGLSTAFIGSSNMTGAAMVVGMEWNVRVSESINPDVIRKFEAVFESYWQSNQFRDYETAEFYEAINRAQSESNKLDLSPFLVSPYPYQTQLLEDILASRSAGFHRNLVVSATGTGKTALSAFDYASIARQGGQARLLFVAHRKEILKQSQRMFAQVLQNPSFGELWVDGDVPAKFDHVFASVQTLAKQSIESIDPSHFDVIIIDEAHHVTAPSYQAILDHFKPKELLGLTATPERGDGQSILPYFGNRIAAELRIWEAIEQQYLSPFAYFSISDGIDLSGVTWRRGSGYDIQELENVYTASHQWISLVIQQVNQKILDGGAMRAIGFCVSVKHAEFVASQFNKAGIKSVALTGKHESDERNQAIQNLKNGVIQAIFTVDLFNEGIDIPNADTLLMMRPTDSALLFMQQIGRGLRRAPNKTLCTILDFVGQNRAEFRFENKFKALVGGTRKELEKKVMEGFPFLPAGCQIILDAHSQEEILNSLKNALPSQWLKMVAELKSCGDISLKEFLAQTGLEFEDIYSKGRSYTELRRAAGIDTEEMQDDEKTLLRGVGRLGHIDDSLRIGGYSNWLSQSVPPVFSSLGAEDKRLVRMFSASVTSQFRLSSGQDELDLIWKLPSVRREMLWLLEVLKDVVDVVHADFLTLSDVPLKIHALYSRNEIQAALDDLKDGKIREFREGVRYLKDLETDIFLFTADKSSTGFSPTTRYRDYAISPTRIHWESQSTISSSSVTGQRYINHEKTGNKILVFGRHSKNDDAFWFLGPARYVSHSGDYPVAFTWQLDFSLPSALLSVFAASA